MSRITTGWLARHTPQGPGGRHAALIDVAQDLLLAHLHEQATFEHLVFKGGTALRKLYAGNAGRFSTDLDFSVRDPADDPTVVSDLLRGEIDGLEIDGFHYRVDDHRGRPQVAYDTPFGGVGKSDDQTRHRTSPVAATRRAGMDPARHPRRLRPADRSTGDGAHGEHGRKDRTPHPPHTRT